jgi:hypothetical protein
MARHGVRPEARLGKSSRGVGLCRPCRGSVLSSDRFPALPRWATFVSSLAGLVVGLLVMAGCHGVAGFGKARRVCFGFVWDGERSLGGDVRKGRREVPRLRSGRAPFIGWLAKRRLGSLRFSRDAILYWVARSGEGEEGSLGFARDGHPS